MKNFRFIRRALAPATAFVSALLLVVPLSLRAQTPSVSNLSTRAQVGTGGNILITGLTIGPGANKTVLIRATGPALTTFGVPGVLADPKLELFSGSTKINENDNWLAADAATFTAVGAFPLTANSKDAALVTTLAPGSYTAQVSGIGGTTGVALIEVYEVGGGGTRLSNISARAQVGTGGNILIPGLVISPGSGTRRLLIRAAGPALGALGVTGTLADPTMSVLSVSGATLATNDNWGTPVGAGAASAAQLSAAFTQAGAFGFANASRDSALLLELAAGNYTIQVSGVGATSGVALVEVYDLTPAGPPTVGIVATKPASDESGTNPGEFTLTRTGDTLSPLTVNYGVGGSAVNGFDYPALLGTVTFPAGAASVKIPLSPNPDLQVEGLDTVILTLTPGPGYLVGAQSSATVTIADSPATLYVSSLRPATGAGASTASGTATILLSASGTLAGVNISFSNLGSAEVSAHLVLGPNEDFVFNLPAGQVTGIQWTFAPTGIYTSTDLLNALKNGGISVRIDTSGYPTGEVKGTFIPGAGSQAFTAPAAPPAISLTNVTAADAARFLTQATFGPKKSEIDALTGGGIDTWLNSQLALPFTSLRAAFNTDFNTFGGANNGNPNSSNRQAAWWKNSLNAPDQLRQRVAFALSEILVVSDVSLGQPFDEGIANYYDLLGAGAFGNFRTLLNDVTLSPIMGNYLSSLRNAKADAATGQTPDENYAREVMQLFTIGLNLLQPDGTLQLGADGLPIPTYNQTIVTEMAKVFTGWSYFTATPTTAAFRTGRPDFFNPMTNFAGFHDDTAKNIVNSVIIPASQGGAKDLQLALDALFTHPNTGPFISRLLIQRLVASNPSPAYVYRVAQKFANNGSGIRGDLAAVVRAILTDYEARSPAVAANPTYGKLKEPILRTTALLRAFGTAPAGGRYAGGNFLAPEVFLDQAALRSPTVFNFFHPAYVLPGPLAAAGLYAPEFEITDATFSIDVPNYLRGLIFTNANSVVQLDLAAEQALVTTPAALLDRLSSVLCGGALPQNARDRITAALAALPAVTTTLERAQTALLLFATSPAATQK